MNDLFPLSKRPITANADKMCLWVEGTEENKIDRWRKKGDKHERLFSKERTTQQVKFYKLGTQILPVMSSLFKGCMEILYLGVWYFLVEAKLVLLL